MEILGLLWNEIIMRPMINSLALLYYLLFNNFGLSIIVFTVLIRLAMIPLTIRQTRSMQKMQGLQPKLKALQEKFKNKSGDDRKQLSQETMKIYREAGVSPVGCLGPMIIQMPIWIGLYRAIIRTMPSTPEGMANLSESFYSWNPAIAQIPLNSMFMGIDLVDNVQNSPIPWNFALPVLVGASMWIMQKMTMTAPVDPRQAQTNQIMLWMMPIMFGFFTLQFPAGLAVYILFSNIIGVVIQYFVGGRQPISIFGFGRQTPVPAPAASAVAPGTIEPSGEKDPDEQSEVLRQDGRRSDRTRPQHSRRRTRRRRHSRR